MFVGEVAARIEKMQVIDIEPEPDGVEERIGFWNRTEEGRI